MPSEPFEFTLQFARGIGDVDSTKGILHGVTVAEVGEARGHFAFLNPAGDVLGVGGYNDIADYPQPVRRMQLAMDERSLETVVEASKKTPRVRTREDHSDSVGSRAGFADNFRMLDGRVVCDQTIFENYRNRGVVLETAKETPELIGLSGEFRFNAEVVGNVAMMRVTLIEAVDIVDQGALTHAGLFSVKKARRVDSIEEGKAEQLSKMASKNPPPFDLVAFGKQVELLKAYRAENAENIAEVDALLGGLGEKPAAPAVGTPPATGATEGNVSAAVRLALKTELTNELKADFAAQVAGTVKTETERAVSAAVVEMKKGFSALGLKPEGAPAASADGTGKGGTQTPAEGTGPADFLTLRAKIQTERKLKLWEAHKAASHEHKAEFRAFELKRGIITADT